MMTEDTKSNGQGKKEPALKPSQLIAGAIAAVTSSVVIGSLLGTKGTIIGIALGSVISGSAAAIYEKVIKEAQEFATHHKTINKGHAVELTRRAVKPKPVIAFAIAASCCLVVLFGGASAVEAAAGRTLHGIFTGSDNKGLTLGGNYYPTPKPTVTQYVTPTPTYVTVTATPTPSFSTPASPTPTSSRYSTATPSVNNTPSTAEPSPSPLQVTTTPDGATPAVSPVVLQTP